ncbi:MAG: hypothetical protein HYV29_08075 [Ignavibacteriales bacterium]|nr:hypothetical protein [Ignavibacteriales bacterium]
MQTVKGGYSFIEFDSDPNFTAPKRIYKLLKTGTGFTPKTLTEEMADNKSAAVAKGVDLSIRSADVDDGVASAYAALKSAEEARTPLYFRLVHILGNEMMVHNCDAAWSEYVAPNATSQVQNDFKQEGTGSELLVFSGPVAGDALIASAIVDVDLTEVMVLKVWVSTWLAKAANDLKLMLADNVDWIETIPLPALRAGRLWEDIPVVLLNPAALPDIVSIGIKSAAGVGAPDRIEIDAIRGVKARVTILKDVIVNVIFEKNESGKFNAMKLTGVGFADSEANLLTNNF